MKKIFNVFRALSILLALPAMAFAQATPCAGVVTSYPLTQSFENISNLWTQSSQAAINWDLNVGPTFTPNTGPSAASDGLAYLYVEATNQLGSGILESPCFDLTSLTTPQLTFDYHMWGPDAFRLVIQASIDGGNTWQGLIFSVLGDQGPNWNNAVVSLSNFRTVTNFRFRVIGVIGVTNGDEGDIAIDNFVIGEAPACFDISVDFTDASCNGADDGAASLLVFPPNTTGLSVEWSTNETTTSIANLAPGNYAVTVTDNALCTKVKNFTITEPTAIAAELSITPASGVGTADGSVTAQVSGGTPPYTLVWYNGTFGATNSNLLPGYEELKVTDANGCYLKMPTFIPVQQNCSRSYNNWPYHLSFDGGLGRFRQASDDDRNWARRSSGTPTANTGPSGPAQGTRYRYVESSGAGSPFKTAAIESRRCFNISGLADPELSFQYHMYGAEMGSLFVQVSTDGGGEWQESIWWETGDQGDQWLQATVDLSGYSSNQLVIRIVGRTGPGQLSDIAIDDLHIRSASSSSLSAPDIVVTPMQAAGSTQSFEEGDPVTALYPNPVTSALNLEHDDELREVRLIDINGRLIYLLQTEKRGEMTIDLAGFDPGLYLLLAIDQQGQWYPHKIMKQ